MKKATIEELQKRLDENNPHNSIILNYDDVNHPLIKCGECGEIFSTTFNTLLRNKYKVCPSCARKLQKTKLTDISIVEKECIDHGFKPLFNSFNGVHSCLLVEDEDGYIGELSLVSIRKGSKISRFAKYNKYALINLRKYCNDSYYDCYIPEQDYLGWDFPIKVICSCGEEYTTTVTHLVNDNQTQCVNCSGSKSNNEKTIENWLSGKNIEYINQYIFKDCKSIKSLPFDFYLPEYNCCIEVDGEGHFRPTRFNGIDKERAEKLFLQTKERDKIKEDYCYNNNIDLLRIKYEDINNGEYDKILSFNFH